MPVTVSSDKIKLEQVLLIHSTLALLMATEDSVIQWSIMCTTPLRSARSNGLIHR